MPLLSVIIPVYNQVDTIRSILDKLRMVEIDKQIIVVDDGSNDGTGKVLRDSTYDNLKIIHHSSNRGRGAAVLTGLAHAEGEFAIIHDAHWECDPTEYLNLMQAIQGDGVDIIVGSTALANQHKLFMQKIGARISNLFLNLLFNSRIGCQTWCCKLMRKDTLNGLNLKSRGWSIDLEIICAALKKKQRILEIPVSCTALSRKFKRASTLRQILYIIKSRFGKK